MVLSFGQRFGEFQAVAGAPAGMQRFEKDIIRIGTYTHPTKGWTLDVTPQRLTEWEANFKTMQGAGVKVPATQDHSNKAADVVGELVGVERRGDRLVGLHDLDADGQKLAAKTAVETSVEIDDQYRIPEGNKLIGSALTASSLVQRPIISKQTPFVKIAASREGGDPEEFNAPVLLMGTEKETPMKALIALLNTTFNLAIAEDADEKTIVEAAQKLVEDAKSDEVLATKLLAVETELVQVKANLAAAPNKIELSREVKAMSIDSLDTKLAKLVSDGKITPAVSEKLKPHLGTDRNLSVVEGAERPGYNGVLDALAEMSIVELGEQSNHQVIALSRETPDADSGSKIDPDLQARAESAYGKKPAAAAAK